MKTLNDVGSKPPNKYTLSVIIPVLNEQEQINFLIQHLRGQGFQYPHEIIVVDGDPQGRTVNTIQDKHVATIVSERGRGRQMNAGAALARGEILVFLHADTKLPKGALKKISRVMENEEYVAGAFDLDIDTEQPLLKYIAARARLRSRRTRIPYGDQAIFIRKNYFDKVGGFKQISLIEDIDLMRRIKKDGKQIHILRDRVITSARRWENEGILRTTLKNRLLVALYRLGVSPEKLAKHYYKKSQHRWFRKRRRL